MSITRWRQLAEISSDAIFVVDEQGTICFANAAAGFLGWTAEEFAARPLDSILAIATNDDVTESGLLHERLLRSTGESLSGFTRMLVRHRLGVQGEVEARALELSPNEGEPGQAMIVVRLLHQSQEFTSYPSNASAEPPKQNQLYKLVFDCAPVGLLHFDERGMITAANDQFANIVAASKETLIGLDMKSLPNPKLTACVKDAIAGKPALFEGEYRSILASKLTLARVQFTPTFDSDGAVTGGIAIVEDITERTQTEHKLAAAERMASLGALAAGVAHELNNPLAFSLAGIEIAQRLGRVLGAQGADFQTLAKLIATLTDAHEGIERVRILVRDLKSFARSADERREPVDVEEVLDIAAKLTRAELRHRARLIRRYNNVPPVWGVESRLVQVFVNLLVNAASSIEEGSVESNTVTLVTREKDDFVTVEICDTGSGISPDYMGRIFEPFWSGHPEKGSGLGLSICHGIITSHEGEISVSSILGEGTTFSVRLPKSPDNDVTARSMRTTMVATPLPTRKMRILIIDDEEAMCRTLQMGLGDTNIVDTANTGREGLDLIEKNDDYDVILCDLMLPDLPGPDVYREATRATPQLAPKFIFMTGGAFTQRSKAFLQEVKNVRLEKPFLLSELETVLAELD